MTCRLPARGSYPYWIYCASENYKLQVQNMTFYMPILKHTHSTFHTYFQHQKTIVLHHAVNGG